MFRGPMQQGGMMGAPQGMPGRGGDRWITGGGYGPGGMGSQVGEGYPGMRGPQPMPPMNIPGRQPMPGGPPFPPQDMYPPPPGMGQPMPPQWGAFPGFGGERGGMPFPPPQFQGGGPAGWGGNRGGGFSPGMPGMSGERGMPGGFGGRPQAGPPVPRRLPDRTYY